MKISVTLANYNHARYLRRCVEGVLSQSYTNLEFVIIDDGSTDESRDILREYQKQDSRINLELQDRNRGAMPTFQRCFSRITGDLMYATASDDYLCDPKFFETVVQWLRVYPSAAGAFARQKVVWNDNGELVCVTGDSPGAGFVPSEICLESYLRGRMLACGISSLWRLPLVKAIGGYPPDLGPFSELYVNHALPSLHGVIFLPTVAGVAQIPRDTSAYSANMEYIQKARYCARLESMLRTLPSAQCINPELFLLFRRRMIDEFILEKAFNEKTIREVNRAVKYYLGFSRSRTLRACWHEVDEAVARVQALFAEAQNNVCREFEDATGIPMPLAQGNSLFDQAEEEGPQRVSDRILKVLFQYIEWIRSKAGADADLRIAVFGAGSHTRQLLRIWNTLGLPHWSRVLVTGKPASLVFADIPISPVSEVQPDQVDLILISSESYEYEMALSCMHHLPAVPRLTFWDLQLSAMPVGGNRLSNVEP